MQTHSTVNQLNSRAMSERASRETSGFGTRCSVAIRNRSYHTRVSAMRFTVGCVTERLSAIRGLLGTHGRTECRWRKERGRI